MIRLRNYRTCFCLLLLLVAAEEKPATLTREQVIEQSMKPFQGTSVKGVDCSTLKGKVMCGYQGWHAAEGDGCGRRWYHWAGRRGFKPGSTNVDLWPDVSELGPEERYATPFRTADGKVAEVYSAFNSRTVNRHFQWMRDYGIDGVFVQRFGVEVFHPLGLRQFTTVLGHCREGANKHGRTYAVMYDLSGMRAGEMNKVMEDWKLLNDKMRITKDPAYLHHNGKPVVAVWGFGFSDGRKYTLQEGLELVAFLKRTPAGGCTVMLGVPTSWRTLERDAVHDKMLLELIAKADIVSPWTVGRYSTPEQAASYAGKTMTPDLAWCKENGKEYLPVVFPGFSWHNQNRRFAVNSIPRRGGEFLWSQFVAAKKAGATMVYQAMFDEVDEGTAIYKCTNDVPVGESTFATYEGLPSDFYLKLVGAAGKMLRGEFPLTDELPALPDHDGGSKIVTPAGIRWRQGPPSLPRGAQMAVLEGDPSREGPFVLRIKLPDGFRVMPHTHPKDERVTVISGTLYLGEGDKFDEKSGKGVPAGSYVRTAAGMKHFGWVKGETVLQLHGEGPWAIEYVDPKDDPRREK